VNRPPKVENRSGVIFIKLKEFSGQVACQKWALCEKQSVFIKNDILKEPRYKVILVIEYSYE